MDILRRLGNIPNHKDPKKAAELQKEIDTLETEKDELEINLMDMQIQIDIHESEIERLYNSIDLINERLGNFYIDEIVEETETTVTFRKIKDGDDKNVETRTIDILSDENGINSIDNISIQDDSLDNDPNMDWFDETLDDYYNRRKNEIKDELKNSAKNHKKNEISKLILLTIQLDISLCLTTLINLCIVYQHILILLTMNNTKNLREQRYNKTLLKK